MPYAALGRRRYLYIIILAILYAARWWHIVIVRVDRMEVVVLSYYYYLFRQCSIYTPLPTIDNGCTQMRYCLRSIYMLPGCRCVIPVHACITYVYNTRAGHSVRTWEPHQYALKSPSLAYYAAETIASGAHVILHQSPRPRRFARRLMKLQHVER